MSFLNIVERDKEFAKLGLRTLAVKVNSEVSADIPVWITPNAQFLVKEEFGWRCIVYQVIPMTRNAWDIIQNEQTLSFNKDGGLQQFVKDHGTN